MTQRCGGGADSGYMYLGGALAFIYYMSRVLMVTCVGMRERAITRGERISHLPHPREAAVTLNSYKCCRTEPPPIQRAICSPTKYTSNWANPTTTKPASGSVRHRRRPFGTFRIGVALAASPNGVIAARLPMRAPCEVETTCWRSSNELTADC